MSYIDDEHDNQMTEEFLNRKSSAGIKKQRARLLKSFAEDFENKTGLKVKGELIFTDYMLIFKKQLIDVDAMPKIEFYIRMRFNVPNTYTHILPNIGIQPSQVSGRVLALRVPGKLIEERF
jgi:hypothetical protein